MTLSVLLPKIIPGARSGNSIGKNVITLDELHPSCGSNCGLLWNNFKEEFKEISVSAVTGVYPLNVLCEMLKTHTALLA